MRNPFVHRTPRGKQGPSDSLGPCALPLSRTANVFRIRRVEARERAPQTSPTSAWLYAKGGLPRIKRESILASVTSPVRTQNPLGRGASGADLTPDQLIGTGPPFLSRSYCDGRRVRLCSRQRGNQSFHAKRARSGPGTKCLSAGAWWQTDTNSATARRSCP